MEFIGNKTIAALGMLAVLWSLEGFLPFFHEFNERGKRYPHAGRNLAVGAFNALVMGALFSGMVVFAAANARDAGLLPRLGLSPWTEAALAILLFDAWM